jgi:hypothetical protein
MKERVSQERVQVGVRRRHSKRGSKFRLCFVAFALSIEHAADRLVSGRHAQAAVSLAPADPVAYDELGCAGRHAAVQRRDCEIRAIAAARPI